MIIPVSMKHAWRIYPPWVVQVIACRLFDAKPWSKIRMPYCKLDPWNQIPVKFESRQIFIRKNLFKTSCVKWLPFCFGIIMTSSNGNIFALLSLYEGNPPVTGGFPSQRPVTRSFDVFLMFSFQRLSKQSRRQWFWDTIAFIVMSL